MKERSGFIDGVPAHIGFFGSLRNKPETMLAFGTKPSFKNIAINALERKIILEYPKGFQSLFSGQVLLVV